MNNNIYDELIRPLTVFAKASGVGVSILDPDGNTINKIGGRCEFCRLIRQEEILDSRCHDLHCEAGKYSVDLGDSYIYNCYAGLVSISLGLFRGKSFLGSILIEPVIMEYPDSDLMESIIKKCGLPPGARPLLFDALKAVNYLDPEKLYYLSQLLANLIYPAFSVGDSEFISRRKKITLQQELISEAIQDQKKSNDMDIFIEEKEKELCGMLISWDKEGSRKVLNDILGRIFLDSGSNREIMKLRVSEIIGFVVSDMYRRGLSDGFVYDEVSGFRQKMAEAYDLQQISYELGALTDKLIEILKHSIRADINPVVKDSLNYIRIHYRDKISLTDVASNIGVSPTHLSRLFSEEMDQRFTDYVNRYRMERARELLTDSDLTLSEIAQAVGYSNQQYFTKVFKDITGVSPGYYRNND